MLALVLQHPGGAVAQLGARLDGIEEVVGSNPIGSTKFPFHTNTILLSIIQLAKFSDASPFGRCGILT
jgi:hypothetical protein